MSEVRPLRYLGSTDVAACLPGVVESVDLAQGAFVALATGGAEMPPKLGLHPRPGALLHAMPAWHRGDDAVGMKWVAAYGTNRARDLPAIHALIIVNDAATGLPLCVMDGRAITAARTAAVSGLAVRLLRPRARTVAFIGSGVQARSHLAVLAGLLPGVRIGVHDRHADRAERLADEARATPGVAAVETATSAREVAAEADVVITMATLGSASQVMTSEWVRDDALVVAVDFATYASAELARAASLFAVDDRAQFLAYRASGSFDGYPDPGTTLGDLAVATDAPAAGLALVTHLGIGLVDVVFGAAVLRLAEERGVGVELER